MTRIKICGITNLEDALVAVEAGADLLGFIFYEPSPRYVAPKVVREIVSRVRCQVSGVKYQVSGVTSQGTADQSQEAGCQGRGGAEAGQAIADPHHVTARSLPGEHNTTTGAPQFVGVFVNSPLATVSQILDFCRLDAAQLHGEEPPEFVTYFEGRAFKALRPPSKAEAENLLQTYGPASSLGYAGGSLPALLLDAYHPNLYGGTGRVTDWTLAAGIARRYPIMLAGSLTPDNVAEAIEAVRPWGVDVSSGVELEKGKKDHAKVRKFIETVRNESL
jgi:phosphoribosylanthranilate isomerase